LTIHHSLLTIYRFRWLRPALLIAVILCAMLLAHLLGVRERIGALREWIASLGAWGPAAFVLVYTAAVVLALPGSLLTVAGGLLFGVVKGVALVSISSTLGASIGFLISRYVARDAVTQWLGKNAQFRALDQLARERGAVIVALTRLVPLFPFNLLNYGFGLTAVPFRTYVFWSWLCMLPGTVLYVAGSDALFSALRSGRVPWSLVLVVILVAALLTLLVRAARQRLNTPGDGVGGPGRSHSGKDPT
jgi:uncharacterized membrane protein YdjX (TVP38/TMEM64 family)